MLLSAAALLTTLNLTSVIVPPSGFAYFTSPTYPSNYEKNTTVNYRITGPDGFGILFDVVDFELCSYQCGYGCFADYVQFWETIRGQRVDISSALCGHFNGSQRALRLASQTNHVHVSFVTSYHGHGPAYRGFNFSATALKQLNTTIVVPASGKIYFTSPNYPFANYFVNRDTIYFISGPEGSQLEFDTVDFEVQDLDIFGGLHDYITFSEDINSKTTLIAPPFFGNEGPHRLQSHSNHVMANFKSDDYITRRGFNISVEAV